MNLGHPVLKNMINLGCKCQTKIFLAFQTYLELCEVQKAQDVDYYYNEELDLIYIVARIIDQEEVYIPLGINDSISPRRIRTFQEALSKHCEGKVMYLALRDVDTSCVIYKVSEGLEKPLSPEASKEKKDLKEKRNLIETEIYNLIPSLIKQARSNDPVAT